MNNADLEVIRSYARDRVRRSGLGGVVDADVFFNVGGRVTVRVLTHSSSLGGYLSKMQRSCDRVFDTSALTHDPYAYRGAIIEAVNDCVDSCVRELRGPVIPKGWRKYGRVHRHVCP